MVQTLPHPDNANYALEKLREMLREGDFGADGKLPTERALSAKLGLGRRAIRRALEVLEAEGEIWRRQGAGTFAGQRPGGLGQGVDAIVAGADFMEIMEVRLRIEPQLAQLAALRAKPAELARMRDLARRIKESDDADARELWDGALHRQIAQSARNGLFLTIFDVINQVRQGEAWQNIRERARTGTGISMAYAQHDDIIAAIAARDPAQAGEAMRQHLLMLQERLIRATSLDHDTSAPDAADEAIAS